MATIPDALTEDAFLYDEGGRPSQVEAPDCMVVRADELAAEVERLRNELKDRGAEGA
ncbi:MAG TPA: hypothetical protein VG406_27395 [Isosphaeraceae bacterium]|jgi:hypothetical protein|nr:hypothetical protein [Isosphaeraceae bacterium]